MNRFWPIVVLSGVFDPPQLQAQEAQLSSLDQAVAPITWPPQHMQHFSPAVNAVRRGATV